MTCKCDEYRNMLEDVVNELDLSAIAIEKHGPLGTPPAELVRLVLAEKDKVLSALQHKLVATFADGSMQVLRAVVSVEDISEKQLARLAELDALLTHPDPVVDADIKAGRVTRYMDADEFFKELAG